MAFASILNDKDKELLCEIQDHLEYCGWGDSWERELAEGTKLPERLEEFMKRTSARGVEEKSSKKRKRK